VSKIFERFVRPLLFRFPAESAHELGIKALEAGLARRFVGRAADLDFGPLRRFGLDFPNPIGVAAGFDKNCVVADELSSLGFGFVEVGTVTFHPQPGNEKPRLFRLPKDKALLNRLGFNNDGAEAVARRLKTLERRCVIGVNIGRNKDVANDEAVENYLAAFDILKPLADYVTINVSSPNTPNLRDLQHGENLEELLIAIQTRNREADPKPLLVKIAPDLTEAEIEQIVDTCARTGIDGIIATNTTTSRDGLTTANVSSLGAGGISGRPLTHRSTEVIRLVYRFSQGKLPIVGVGGIFTADDAFDKIAAGASLLQSYTGFVYGGPTFASDINLGLRSILTERGFKTLDEAVGSAA